MTRRRVSSLSHRHNPANPGGARESLGQGILDRDGGKEAFSKTDGYTVKRGDNLVSIAKAQLGDSGRWKEIYALNQDEIGHYTAPLYPSQRLILPKSGEERS